MAATTSPDETFPALTIVDLEPLEHAESLDEITRAQLEKANRLYSGADLKAEQILAPVDHDQAQAEDRIDPEYLEHGRVIDGGGHHVYDVFLYMVDSGTFFARGSTDVAAEVAQFRVQSDDRSLAHALDRALATLRKAPAMTLPGGGTSPLDDRSNAARGVAPAKGRRKPAAKKTASRKPAATKTAAKKPAATKTTAKKPAAAKTAARKPAATKTAARKPATGKTAAGKPAARRTAARKPAARKTTAGKPAARKATGARGAKRSATTRSAPARETRAAARKPATARKAAPKATASARKPTAKRKPTGAKKAGAPRTTARKAAPRTTASRPAKKTR